jgi:hypothetical protein
VRRHALPLLVMGAVALVAPLAASSQAAGPAKGTYLPYATGITGGEPSIGYDPKADAAIFGSGIKNVRMTWDAKNNVTLKRVDAPSSVTTLDAITFTDQVSHRTFVSQLAGACSLTSYSDDAGATWQPSQGCGAGVLLDHQTFGGGPYVPEAKPATATAYGRAVYYCAQNSYSGACARSDDGGATFLSGVPAYNTPANVAPDGDSFGGACSAIHGHVRVGPDGVVYLPNKGCGGTPTAENLTNSEFFGGTPALSVSEDNGQTWTIRKVNFPNDAHNADESDPSVDTDKAGTVFFGFEDGVNPSETVYGTSSSARISVSHDHGRTFSKPYDLSTPLGLHNVQFPEVIAGDKGRAAMSFIGTPSIGDDQHNGFKGDWHLYISTTIDDGKTWTTVDTTPKDPVQRGCISLQGTSNKTVQDGNICSQRNLLDFNDITVDRQGRVLVAYSDGCVKLCIANVTSVSKGAVDMVMRQITGPLLYAKAAAITPPVVVPPRAVPPAIAPGSKPGTGTGALAATGGAPGLALAAVLLLGAAFGIRRFRRRS